MSKTTKTGNFAADWWARVSAGERIVQKCNSCGSLQLHPRRRCNSCASDQLDFEAVSGDAKIYSFTEITHAAPSDFVAQMPYVLAIVRLIEGPQILSRIVNSEASELRCDMSVKWTLAPVGDRMLPCFELC